MDDDGLRELVELAAQNDADAWEALYRRSYRRLFSFARRRLFDDQAADDVVSETMTRALDGIGGFTWRGGGFDAWLYGIARNVVAESGRARQRMASGPPIDLPSSERGPEDQAIAAGDSAALRLAFERLAADDQEVLELRIQGGLSAQEVGALIDKRPGAVRMSQARALVRLRTMYEEVSGAG